MKRSIPLCAILLVIVSSPLVRAEGSLSDTQMQIIQANCVSSQITLQHIQEGDLLTRINRGHRYDTLLKLMTNLNSRVVQNKLDTPDLISIASEYQNVFDSFRDTYTSYDSDMTTLIQMDCRSQPTAFNDRLVALRSKRVKLSSDVVQFNTLLDKYQKGVNDLQKQQENS